MESVAEFPAAPWLAEFVHVGCVMLLFGASLFPFYARVPSYPGKWERLAPLLMAAGAFLGAVVLTGLTIADATGGAENLLSLEELNGFFFETSFGWIFAARIVLAALAAGFAAYAALAAAPPSAMWRNLVFVLLAGSLLIAVADLSHAAAMSSRRLAGWAVLAETIHLLTGAIWIGALPPLLVQIRQPASPLDPLERFSAIGQWNLVILFCAGVAIIMISFGIMSLFAGWAYLYRAVLALKIILFFGMAGLAAANRFVYMPKLEVDPSRRSGLIVSVTLECVLGAGAVLAATALGRLAHG